MTRETSSPFVKHWGNFYYRFYLDHTDATNPAVDSGTGTGFATGFTTDLTQAQDTGTYDIGYHFPIHLERIWFIDISYYQDELEQIENIAASGQFTHVLLKAGGNKFDSYNETNMSNHITIVISEGLIAIFCRGMWSYNTPLSSIDDDEYYYDQLEYLYQKATYHNCDLVALDLEYYNHTANAPLKDYFDSDGIDDSQDKTDMEDAIDQAQSDLENDSKTSYVHYLVPCGRGDQSVQHNPSYWEDHPYHLISSRLYTDTSQTYSGERIGTHYYDDNSTRPYPHDMLQAWVSFWDDKKYYKPETMFVEDKTEWSSKNGVLIYVDNDEAHFVADCYGN